ncbi:MAG: REP-associated tyrosine transposase [Verrucomicrobiota bacterium]|jgi:REP element-mobilizing transposase RayT
MPRSLRIEYPGARYHVMSRGDRREDIFLDAADREMFLSLLGRACGKTGWEVHAYCLMSNHWHAVIETSQANLSSGMRWLLGTYTQSFNRRHRQWGHLFGGRYKAQLVDERSAGYLRCACDYVHLNPRRAGLVATRAPLESYPWSSYPAYLRLRLRPDWLRVDRLLGEHGLEHDTAAGRREFGRRTEACAAELQEQTVLRRGWTLGGEDFVDWIADKLTQSRSREGTRRSEGRAVDETLAERLARDCLRAVGWSLADLRRARKGDPVKVAIAQRLRAQTPMTRRWIAERLQMGSCGYLSNLLKVDDVKL